MRDNLDRDVSEDDLIRLRCMDDPDTIEDIFEIGRRAADLQVKECHWQGEMAQWCVGMRAPPLPRSAPPDPVSLWTRTRTSAEQITGAVRSAIGL